MAQLEQQERHVIAAATSAVSSADVFSRSQKESGFSKETMRSNTASLVEKGTIPNIQIDGTAGSAGHRNDSEVKISDKNSIANLFESRGKAGPKSTDFDFFDKLKPGQNGAPIEGHGQNLGEKHPFEGHGHNLRVTTPISKHGHNLDEKPPSEGHGHSLRDTTPISKHGHSLDDTHPFEGHGHSLRDTTPISRHGHSLDDKLPIEGHGHSLRDTSPISKHGHGLVDTTTAAGRGPLEHAKPGAQRPKPGLQNPRAVDHAKPDAQQLIQPGLQMPRAGERSQPHAEVPRTGQTAKPEQARKPEQTPKPEQRRPSEQTPRPGTDRTQTSHDAGDKKAGPRIEVQNKGASPEFANLVQTHVDSLQPGVRKLMEEKGIKVVVGDTVTGVFTDLKGEKPRGWPPGSTWDNADGLFSHEENTVLVTEHRVDGSKTVHNDRAEGVAKHEIGHAVDTAMGSFSQSEEFNKAYDADVSKIPEADRKKYEYLLQAGTAGKSETFAEVFGALNGSSANPQQTADTLARFPTVAALLQAKFKEMEH